MFEEQLRELCRKLKPMMGSKADSLWLAYLTSETPKAKQEAEAFIQMCAIRHLSRRVDDEKILLPPPSEDLAGGEFLLGRLHYGDQPLHPLYLRRENFMKHVGIFSITGGGKTNVGFGLLLGLLKQGIPFLVVDWKRGYRALLSLPEPAAKRVRVFTVGRKTAAGFLWNPLRGPPGVHPQTWIAIVAEALEKSHISGQGVADILIDVFDKLFEQFGFYDGDHSQYPNFFDARLEVAKVKLRGRRMLWQDSCLRILRTFVFGPAAGAFNARHPIKIEELLEKPVIFELDQELPKPLRVFFSDLMVRWIHLYRLGQGESRQLRHVTVLEEVHNLFPRSSIEKQATNSLENIFREIRGFGEGLINITQHPSLLPIYVLGNCNTQIYLGLQHEDDIVTAKRALFIQPDEQVYLDRLAVGEGIVKIKGRVAPCHIRFPLIPVKIGAVTDEMIAAGGGDNSTQNMD